MSYLTGICLKLNNPMRPEEILPSRHFLSVTETTIHLYVYIKKNACLSSFLEEILNNIVSFHFIPPASSMFDGFVTT